MSNTNILESWTKNDDQKAVWLKTDKYTIGLEINTAFDSAFVSVRNNIKNPDAHNLAIGLNKEGKSFLQVSDGENVKTVDLFKVMRFVTNMMEKKYWDSEIEL
jgi:hypothetical protein